MQSKLIGHNKIYYELKIDVSNNKIHFEYEYPKGVLAMHNG